MSYSKSGFFEIAAGADLTLCIARVGKQHVTVVRDRSEKPLSLLVYIEKQKVIPPAAVCRGPAALERFQRWSFLALLQNLPSQLACLSTIMAGSWPRVWTHDLPCRAHHRVEEAVMVACVCVCALLAGSRARLSCCAEGNQAVTAPLSGQGSPRGDAGKVSTSPSADFTSSCQNSCYVLFLILSTKYTQKRLI